MWEQNKKTWTKKIILLVSVWVVLFALDLISKYLFYNVWCCAHWIWVAKVFNTGISRGVALPSFLTFLVSALAIVLFVWLYIKNQFTWWMMALIMAGTLGNLYDRIFLHGVRDFIAIGHFPVFNFADIWLNLGIFLFIIREFRGIGKIE